MQKATTLSEALWSQFGAGLEMLENAILGCPDVQLNVQEHFGYTAYHCLFWTDYYLSMEPEAFSPPAPFTLSEFDPDGIRPERPYTKSELLMYLGHCRHKARTLLTNQTETTLNGRWKNGYKDFTVLEIVLYNLRHIQHHTGQLQVQLRQMGALVPEWVGQAEG